MIHVYADDKNERTATNIEETQRNFKLEKIEMMFKIKDKKVNPAEMGATIKEGDILSNIVDLIIESEIVSENLVNKEIVVQSYLLSTSKEQ